MTQHNQEDRTMSTQAIRRLIQSVKDTELGQRIPARVAQTEEDVAAIEKAARALVAWNEKGRPATDLDAARGYGVMERIAREAGEPITADGGTSGDPKANG
jgi:ferritin-like metal-binding protein YciE